MQNFRKSLPGLLFFIFGFLLPVQLGKHWWPTFAFVHGVRTDYLSPTLYLTDLILIVLVGYILFVNWSVLLRKRLIIFLMLCGIVGSVCYFYAPVKGLFLYRLWQYSKTVLAAFVFYRLSATQWKWFLYGLIGSSFYSLLLVVLQIVNRGALQGVWWWFGERLFSIGTPGISTVTFGGEKLLRGYGTFSHPNSLAGFFLIVYALCFQSGLWLFSIPAILLVLLSFSKAGVVVFAVSFLFFELQKKNGCLVCRSAKALFGIWLLLFLFLFHGSSGTSYERLPGWLFAVATITHNPFGASLGNYLFNGQPVHSIILLFGMEAGIVGFATVGAVYAYAVHVSKISLRLLFSHKEVVLLLIVLTTGMVDHYWLTLQQNMLLLGVVLGITINRIRTVKTRRSI